MGKKEPERMQGRGRHGGRKLQVLKGEIKKKIRTVHRARTEAKRQDRAENGGRVGSRETPLKGTSCGTEQEKGVTRGAEKGPQPRGPPPYISVSSPEAVGPN